MHRMTLNWTWTLNSQKYLLTPEAQILVRFPLRLAVSVIQHVQRWAKIRNAPNDPKMNLSTLQSKVLYIHLVLTSEVQILVRFALWLAVSEIQHVQGQRKSEMHRMTPNWTWTLNSQKYSLYTIYLLTPGAQILVRFALRLDVPEIQHVQFRVGEYQKCHEWPQTEREYLAVKITSSVPRLWL